MFDPETLKRYPAQPGVYLMKDEADEVLYVGKAKHLRNRLKQYFLKGGDGRPQIPYLLARVVKVETVVVTSDKEAILLENNLIKQHQPRYNVLLKDDKSYISLKVTTKHQWPMIKLARYKGKPKKDGLYFGPYTSTYAARQTLELLIRLFPLRRCSDRELASRSRPCILYQIKRCVAPCVGYCSKEEYDHIVDRVVKFLKGKDKEVLNELYVEMEKASERLEFEQAEQLLQTIHHIEHTIEQQQVDQAGRGDHDVIALYREGGEVSLTQMLFRDGKLVGAQNYSFTSNAQDDSELLSSFILQTYADKTDGPKEIYLPIEIEEVKTLAELIDTKIVTPKRGDKKSLIEMAETNAKASFHQERSEKQLREKRLISLQEKLNLNNYPRRIECFDNSNLGADEPVAGMITFLDGEADKSRYRKYKLKSLSHPDDYSAMYEVLTRRLKRGKEEDDLPDLIIVDGGKGQLNIASKVLHELNIVTVDIIGLTKEEARHDKGLTAERVFIPGKKEAIYLGAHSPTLFLLQQIRDEAHRFAITFLKQRHKKRILQSALDDLPGIGPVKKKRLMRTFGSIKRMLEATDGQLLEVQGITNRDIGVIRQLKQP